MDTFGPKPWINPFGKISIFRLFQFSCFYSLERRFFVLEYRKRHFADLYCLKKKSWKNGHFWTKLWINPFVEVSIFLLFQLLAFIA